MHGERKKSDIIDCDLTGAGGHKAGTHGRCTQLGTNDRVLSISRTHDGMYEQEECVHSVTDVEVVQKKR